METGIEVLEKWADDATPRDKDVVYAALFATTDRSLFRTHDVLDDEYRLNEFFVLLEGDVVIKMRVNGYDSFGLVYIGPRTNAPGLTSATR
ncbi:DUF6235 family protein [Actinophytocola sp.]|uniref:DUF6235 family protein n=1 Tax=Actinophytocola sp. TaxID=1872138 RepID=UPI002ED446C4